MRTVPRPGLYGHGVSDARIYALQDRPALALAALRQAVDDGWRHEWWFYADQDPTLDSIRNGPEFQTIMAEIRADMAAQRRRVGEANAIGE